MTAVAADTLKSISKIKRKAYIQEFKKLKQGDRSEDSIHDARVAARRLNAVLETLSIISDSSENKKIKKMVKNSRKKISLDSLFTEIKNEKETLISEFDLLNRDDKSSFHQLRKDFKKLRYKLEILNEINITEYDIDNYKQFQDDLGEIQDIEVIREILNNDFKSDDNENVLDNLNKFLDKEQNKLIDKILNNRNLFISMMEINIFY
jgi:CHAD domain-containing protein